MNKFLIRKSVSGCSNSNNSDTAGAGFSSSQAQRQEHIVTKCKTATVPSDIPEDDNCNVLFSTTTDSGISRRCKLCDNESKIYVMV